MGTPKGVAESDVAVLGHVSCSHVMGIANVMPTLMGNSKINQFYLICDEIAYFLTLSFFGQP